LDSQLTAQQLFCQA
jgi:hypothetical protein